MDTHAGHPRLPELGRRRFLQAGVAGGALVRILAAPPALADQALDIQILQTAASIENLVFSAYETILGLPVTNAPNVTGTLKAILSAARTHHADHAAAYNDAVAKLGGRAQDAPNPGLGQLVNRERARLGDLASAIDLALQLETAAAQTYQANVAALSDLNARRLCSSILGVEAQHAAVLAIVRSLLVARMPEAVTDVGVVTGRLPAEVGQVGAPDAFAKTDQARPPGEGALR